MMLPGEDELSALRAQLSQVIAERDAAREREALLREQIGILQATVAVLRDQLEALRTDQTEMRKLLASVHGVLAARYLAEAGPGAAAALREAQVAAPAFEGFEDEPTDPRLRVAEPGRVVEARERGRAAAPRTSGRDPRSRERELAPEERGLGARQPRPEPPRRAAAAAARPGRAASWREALWNE